MTAPTPAQLRTLLPRIIDTAKAAGQAIMAVYDNADRGIVQKDDKTPVTDADYAAHRLIVEQLGALQPQYPVLSEESESIPFAERAGWATYWLIDPLDGTREFIKRNGEFTVNIALVHGHDTLLGVVYTPALGITYEAAHGLGARRHDAHGTQRIHVRAAPPTPVIAGSRSHAGPHLQAMLENIGDYELISMGSALKTCLVAEGRADLYPRLGLTSEWDTAAAQCVLEEAGGQLTDTQGRRLRYNTKESLLNPHFLAFGDASRDWVGLCPAP
ncbi:3'(2'),5'-bisphosphate nucleotidase CysQ [Acidihalobacter ferrooxydans]|uniref:3'(2'),5'-bisphosphate nucleotidase CysQ n=1 Tax=Acidihalobacter ferrooxydans TaxID=1765967 RepID=A0A1P8UKF0_9GAMM|nr:3'(2'),5'-bisphosphate nucleotidase CysQ [Acidihalobacter ferrooxydans]APZ44295.1 3'(2'),5'-bisphosphate nucleotidase [Acidihalobacter ferrooxydans]